MANDIDSEGATLENPAVENTVEKTPTAVERPASRLSIERIKGIEQGVNNYKSAIKDVVNQSAEDQRRTPKPCEQLESAQPLRRSRKDQNGRKKPRETTSKPREITNVPEKSEHPKESGKSETPRSVKEPTKSKDKKPIDSRQEAN